MPSRLHCLTKTMICRLEGDGIDREGEGVIDMEGDGIDSVRKCIVCDNGLVLGRLVCHCVISLNSHVPPELFVVSSRACMNSCCYCTSR